MDLSPARLRRRPLSTQWLSDERIAEARRVWSKAYGRVISEDEAIEILMNVRRLAEVVVASRRGETKIHECDRAGRVSSREQREGYSIDAQLRVTRERAQANGWHVVREFVVAESGQARS